MKTFKNIIFAALTVISCFCASPLVAQTPLIGCTPPTISCDACACTLALPSGCTEKTYWLEVFTTSPNCHLTVEFRVRLCDDPSNCYVLKCQISIDKIYPFGGCDTCQIANTADLKEAMEQIQVFILSHLYEACGHLTPGNQYDYVVSKPACWKKVTTGGISTPLVVTYEPCDRSECCVSSFCDYWDTDGTHYIVQAGPTPCPNNPPNCANNCPNAMMICD